MANPFFSGRIPQDLLDRVEQHVKETGQSKTEILISALAAYLNHPITKPTSTRITTEAEERFRSLENRVTALELKLLLGKNTDKQIVISTDNNENTKINPYDNNDNITDDRYSVADEEDPWQQNIDTHSVINFDNKVENEAEANIQHQEKFVNPLPEHIPMKFENLTSGEMFKATGLRQTQLDGHRRKVALRFKKIGQLLEDKRLLDTPEKIEAKQPIIIHNYPYDLFYLGQNEKGSNLWSAFPYDNKRYHQLSIQISSGENLS